MVARALSGQTDQLKERILGVEIFDRPADYDTNTDPIVRVTAAEIRKRIEHYYQDPQHSHEIRMILAGGILRSAVLLARASYRFPATALELPSERRSRSKSCRLDDCRCFAHTKRTFIPEPHLAFLLAA